MLSLSSLSLKERQKFKAFLVEQKNNGVENFDVLIADIDKAIRRAKHPTMSEESILKAKRRKVERLKKKNEQHDYINLCPSCGNGTIVRVEREGVEYRTCARLFDGRLQAGCGFSEMVK